MFTKQTINNTGPVQGFPPKNRNPHKQLCMLYEFIELKIVTKISLRTYNLFCLDLHKRNYAAEAQMC